MVDLKYGLYKIIFWLPFITIFTSLEYSFRGWLQILVTILVAAIFFIIATIFEKKHITFKEKNRQTTIKHFRGIFDSLLVVLFLTLGNWLSTVVSSSAFALFSTFLIALSDIVPSFFTCSKKGGLS